MTSKSSWDTVSRIFVDNFTMNNTQRLAELELLANRKQLPSETVDDYLLDINKRCSRLQRGKESEFEHAIQGLLPHIKQQVLLQQATCINDIRRIGQLCEMVQPNMTIVATSGAKPDTDTNILDLVATLKAQIEKQDETIRELSEKQTQKRDYNRNDTPCQWCGLKHCKGKTMQNREQHCAAYNKTCRSCKALLSLRPVPNMTRGASSSLAVMSTHLPMH